ncbi:MAG: hypothetical protein FWF15_07300, partial [Oscillospiraceae bacterium]|nr:hypothetical protein [Oscillospiraceae bacterium]
EPINDAVYARNLRILEDYGVEIVNKEVSDVFSEARKLIMAGEDVYDIVTPYIDASFQMAQNNELYNLNDIPYLSLANPWWDHVIIEKLSLNNKLYTITGDISMDDEELNWCLIANKVILEQNNLLNLYDVIKQGKWTFEYFHQTGKTVTRDLNGDGILDHNDIFAFGNDYGSSFFFYFASGENIAVLDKDGNPQLTVGNQRSLNAIEKLTEIYNDTNFILWASKIKSNINGWEEFRVMLKDNRLMMLMTNIFALKELREMVDDFAVFPAPKYDEIQDNYSMIVGTHACNGISIPVTNTNIERTGIILEAMAYHSKEVQDAHMEVTITGKFLRDEESREMLEIIFNNRTYDIGKSFDWGGMVGQIVAAVQNNKSFVPLYEANREKAETAMQKSYDLFLEIDT